MRRIAHIAPMEKATKLIASNSGFILRVSLRIEFVDQEIDDDEVWFG